MELKKMELPITETTEHAPDHHELEIDGTWVVHVEAAPEGVPLVRHETELSRDYPDALVGVTASGYARKNLEGCS